MAQTQGTGRGVIPGNTVTWTTGYPLLKQGYAEFNGTVGMGTHGQTLGLLHDDVQRTLYFTHDFTPLV